MGVYVARLDVDVPSAEWDLEYQGNNQWLLSSVGLGYSKKLEPTNGFLDGGPGTPTFALLSPVIEPLLGTKSTYQTFRSSTMEVYSPAMIERAQANEMIPPKEVLIGGYLRFPGRVFVEAMIGSFRLIEDLRAVSGFVTGCF